MQAAWRRNFQLALAAKKKKKKLPKKRKIFPNTETLRADVPQCTAPEGGTRATRCMIASLLLSHPRVGLDYSPFKYLRGYI